MYRDKNRSTPSSSAISAAKWVLLFLCLGSPASYATEAAKIALIIDDLGDHWRSGARAIDLPGSITYAFLPHTPYAVEFANRAHAQGKGVMLHLPMQAMTAKKLGPGGLTLDMDKKTFIQTVNQAIRAIPHVSGINNHMGSLLTQHPGHMQWLMAEIGRHQELFFLDSRTTHHTVAEQVARENRIPTRRRDIFLDDNPDPEAIAHQFHRLVKKAKRDGIAIAIGHPYDTTLSLLEQQLPRLKEKGIQLVLVSELFHPSPEITPKLRMAESSQIDHQLVYLDELRQPRATTPEHPLSTKPEPEEIAGTQPAI